MGSVQVWSTTHQQLVVPDQPLDVSFTDRASCPQQVPLLMTRPVTLTDQSMMWSRYDLRPDLENLVSSAHSHDDYL